MPCGRNGAREQLLVAIQLQLDRSTNQKTRPVTIGEIVCVSTPIGALVVGFSASRV
jgi:hypothetical protein